MLIAIGAGLITGLIIGLVALSFTVIYNATGIVNFANGTFIMLGGYVSYELQRHAGMPFIPAAIISVAIGTLLGLLIDRVVIGPLRKATHLMQITGLIALASFMDGAFRLIFGNEEKQLPTYLPTRALVPGLNWSIADLAIIGVSLLIIAGLTFFFYRTDAGSYMRATADNPGAVGLVGVNPKLVASASWMIAGGIGTLAAVMILPKLLLTSNIGLSLTLLAFAGVVLGGLGSLPGAIVGGLVLGVVQSIVALSLGGGWEPVVNLLLMLAFLAVVPNGLFGKKPQKALGTQW